MARVTRIVAALATGIGVLFFVLAVGLAGVDPAAGFVFAMGMIVAFVPEGMLPTVTLSLAMGVQRMARRNALIKRLSAVEALGSCTVICTDKTGTLTQNEMTVRELWVAGRRLSVTGTGYAPAGQLLEGGHPRRRRGRRSAPAARRRGAVHQRPPPPALRRPRPGPARTRRPPARPARGLDGAGRPHRGRAPGRAAQGGRRPGGARRRAPRLRELPFDSRRKRMTTVHRVDGSPGGVRQGRPREVLALCTAVRLAGEEQPLGWATLADATRRSTTTPAGGSASWPWPSGACAAPDGRRRPRAGWSVDFGAPAARAAGRRSTWSAT